MISKQIKPFSGERADWPLWNQDLIEDLRLRKPEWLYGATAIVLPEAMYNAQFPIGAPIVPFVAPEHQGVEPIEPGELATALQMSRYDMLIKRYARRKTEYEEYLKLCSAISQDLQGASPAEALDLIKHPIHGMLRVTAAQLYAHLTDTYGILSTADLKENLDILLIPYDPSTSFPVYIAQHVKVHHTQESNGQPMSAQAQVTYLKDGTTHCGLFERVKDLWFINHPAAAQQAFGGALGLAHAMLEFEKNLSRSSTAKSAGYTAAVVAQTTTPTVASLQAQISALHAYQAAAGVTPFVPKTGGGGSNHSGGPAAGGGRGGAGGGGRGGTGGSGVRGSAAEPFYYCWSHGMCNHMGINCQGKRVGHDDNATWRHKNLGSKRC